MLKFLKFTTFFDPVFLFATVLLGGGAGFLMGRAVAGTWRPPWQLAWYGLLIALGVRFIHYAMFAEPLASLASLVVDWLVAATAAAFGYHRERGRQMAENYPWLQSRD